MLTAFRPMARLLRRLAGDRGGNVALIFALTSPLVVGAGGLGVETTYWYNEQLRLQSAVDAAAFAAGIEKRAGADQERLEQAALREVSDNGIDTAGSTLVVDASGTNEVRVAVERQAERYFTAFFSDEPVRIAASSTVSFSSSASACVLALDPTASAAANFSGNSRLNLINCSVMANSVASDAVEMQGSARLDASCIISVGGIVLTSGATLTTCAAPITQAPPAADPYATVTAPSTGGACLKGNERSLTPGRYCGGLSLGGNVTLAPGTYVVSGGTFRINAGANVTGSGVTIYLTGGARTSFNGNATINMSAPTSGPYAGVLLFGDRADIGGSRNSINGTAQSHLTGSLYFPSQALEFLGNFSGVQNCMQIVANTVAWTGNSSMSVDCSAYGIREAPTMTLIRLSQ